MYEKIDTINVRNMHFIRAEKIIKHIQKNGFYKDFAEPTFVEKAKYYSIEILTVAAIAIIINSSAILQLIKSPIAE